MSPDETRAWLALTLNLAVLPGLGTLLQRKWIAGALQLVLAVGGAIGSIRWMSAFGREWARMGSFPIDRGPLFPAGLAGTIAFVTAWAWSAWIAWKEVQATRI